MGPPYLSTRPRDIRTIQPAAMGLITCAEGLCVLGTRPQLVHRVTEWKGRDCFLVTGQRLQRQEWSRTDEYSSFFFLTSRHFAVSFTI